jgi:hypothetical protein
MNVVTVAYYLICELAVRFLVWGSTPFTLPVVSRKLVSLAHVGFVSKNAKLLCSLVLPLLASKVEHFVVARSFGRP